MSDRLDAVPATAEELQLLRDDPARFERTRGLRVEPGWSPFDGALDGALTMLERGVPPQWATHLFVHRSDAAVVGIGGFTGPPVEGTVEIGYAIAPAYRRGGLATEAAIQLLQAAARGGAETVRAHTLAQDSPSTRVLVRLGFRPTEEIHDPHDGRLWRWERPTRSPAPDEQE
ncbi:MAG TPA: GNAT family N-acetyltransferase [Geodermatophilus sp.]|nr:GNAT family N-acetyltransferase [Geodermatophilus sp.]